MALNKNNATTPSFEEPDGDTTTAQDPAEMQRAAAQARLQEAANKRAAEKPAEQQSTGTAVAEHKPTGGQVAKAKPMVNPLETIKNAFTVEYDTLRNLQINQGNVIDRETSKSLGDTVGLELLSFQDQWVIGPGGDDKSETAKELVRYSDDGITTTKGENVQEYLKNLKASYPEAKLSERMVICGALFDIGTKGKKELPDLQDSLVQINLPPTSKAAFKRYQMDQAYKVAKGLIDAEGAQRVKIECALQTRGDNTWTVANFSRWI